MDRFNSVFPISAAFQKRLEQRCDLCHPLIELRVPRALPAGVLDGQSDGAVQPLVDALHGLLMANFGFGHFDVEISHHAVVLFEPLLVVHAFIVANCDQRKL